ncbi:hypothetical protein F5883DRAFT_715448 [Diaporthe sp. PMI_573]|nr:hypothetical protein F5883DRAFT_715448 [Diaporthaceae sp. PMI_573]
MQGFASVIITAMVALVVNAVDSRSAIDGYEIVEITWTVQPDISGALPFNVTGTVQDVWKHINTTWPGYPLPKMDWPPASWPPPRPDHNLTDGYLKCVYPFRMDARRSAIKEGISYLRQVPGRPGMPPGPGSCGRVSCSDQSAIYWCNDHDDSFWVDSFGAIADGAHDINRNCVPGASQWAPPEILIWTKGQIFFDKWNVVVRGDDDHC